jgi:hypothetical protein
LDVEQLKDAAEIGGPNHSLKRAPPWSRTWTAPNAGEVHKLIEQRLGLMERTTHRPPVKVCPECEFIMLAGSLNDFPCIYFLDSGASGNFVSTKYVQKHGLQCSVLPSPLIIRLADGSERKTSAVLKDGLFGGVKGNAEVLHGCHDLPVIDLDGYDVILGREWLKAINPVIDWQLGTVQARAPVSELNVVRKAASDDCISSEDVSAFERSIADVPSVMASLLRRYQGVFRETLPPGLPMKRPIEHHIELKPNAQPVAIKQWRLSPKNIEEQDRQCAKALSSGQIRESTSPYNAPSVFIGKPDGSCRWCQDYRGANTLTVKNKISMPRADDLFDRLKANLYTKLDLKQGFNQIRIAPEDVHKTAFSTSTGHYEWLVMPFGLCNAPATFQSLMQFILKDRLNKSVVVFIDDILIYSNSEEEHLEQVEWVLAQLQKWKLYAAINKCDFMKTEVVYLGHRISARGISVLEQKVQAIVDWPVLQSAKEARSFLGLAGYYRRFVKDFSLIAAPLTELTKSSLQWKWGAEEIKAFNDLKIAMSSVPVLLIPNMDLPFTVTTDASGYAIGAVLSQDQGNGLQPVAYLSHKMSAAERKYPVHEQELLAIVEAMKQWRCYLHSSDQPVHVVTDHQSLKWINTQARLSARQTRWLEYLSEFDFVITYREGSDNQAADALSRRSDWERAAAEEDKELHPQSSTQRLKFRLAPISILDESSLVADIREATPKDPALQVWLTDPVQYGYRLEDGLLRNQQGCVVVPNVRELRTKLLYEVHDAPTGGHLGVEKTLTRLGRYFWWAGIRKEVQQYVESCVACQSNKSSNKAPAGLTHPLPIPIYNWQQVSMDFVGPLPLTSRGNDFIFVVVDRLSKMAHFMPCKQSITAPQTAGLFWREVVRQHGVPEAILSDRDSKFTSSFWQELWKLMGTKLPMSTAYHPQSDGQTERMNRLMEEILRSYVHDTGDDWDEHLTAAELAVNTSKQSSTQFTPFFLNFGREMHLPLDTAMSSVSQNPNQAAASAIGDMHKDVASARNNIQKAQTRQAKYADQRRRIADEFKVGDQVMLSTKDLSGWGKLMSKYVGPFRVLGVLPDKMVELELPKFLGRRHPNFNVSKVKMFHSSVLDFPGRQQLDRPKPELVVGDVEYFSVESITGKRQKQVGRSRRYVTEYLVKWLGYDATENTWQTLEDLSESQKVLDEIARFEGSLWEAEAE